jgi:hypothetical protein
LFHARRIPAIVPSLERGMLSDRNKVKPLATICGLYTRVSSRNQADADYSSLETQKERLEAYCQSPIPLDRPAPKEMLRDVREGRLNCVLTYKIEGNDADREAVVRQRRNHVSEAKGCLVNELNTDPRSRMRETSSKEAKQRQLLHSQ